VPKHHTIHKPVFIPLPSVSENRFGVPKPLRQLGNTTKKTRGGGSSFTMKISACGDIETAHKIDEHSTTTVDDWHTRR